MTHQPIPGSADQTPALPKPSSANGTRPRSALLVAHEGPALDATAHPAVDQDGGSTCPLTPGFRPGFCWDTRFRMTASITSRAAVGGRVSEPLG